MTKEQLEAAASDRERQRQILADTQEKLRTVQAERDAALARVSELEAALVSQHARSDELGAALAEAGCDTAARNSEGRTGLMHAACSGSAAAVEAVVLL